MAGGDDDTTPDPLSFKNVPRRPRSAAPLPRKDEPDGGDPGGISSVSNNAPLPAASVPSNSNKRFASSTAGKHGSRAKKHRLLAPIEEPEPKANHRGVGMLGSKPPALSHKEKAPAAAAAAASTSSSEAERAVDWAEKERCRKGKKPVVNEDDDACAAVARRRPAGSGLGNGKLLADAIRSHARAAIAGSFKRPPSRTTKPEKARTKPKKPRKDRNRTKPKKDSSAWFWCAMGRDGMSSAGSDADYSFDRIGVVSDRLRATLRDLGVAAAPVRLYGRLLTRCDRETQQARLLMSCKRWRAEGVEFPLCAFLTEQEKEAAYDEGLPLTAYDRRGEAYKIKFRFLESNGACRLISSWTNFLRDNGLIVGADEPPPPENDDVMLDLWLFRTTPGGKVGMVMLHYRRGDAPHADAALDEVEQKRLQLMLNNGAAADAVMEDAVADANEEAGVIGEVAAAVPAPSSPSEPSGGGAIEAAATSSSPSEPDASAVEEHAGAIGEVADDAPSTSSELHGGASRSDEVTAPLLLLGGGDGTESERAEAGGVLMVMVGVVEVEAATQSAIEVAGPPSSPEQAGGGADMMETEDEDEAAADMVEAAARSWNVTKYEFQAAQGLLMLSSSSEDNSDS